MGSRRALSPIRLAAAGLVVLAIAAVVFVATSSDEYLFVPDRAHPLASLIDVPGAKQTDTRGGIYFVDVVERKATLLERLFPGLRSGATVVRHQDLVPPGVTDAERVKADQLDMRQSQRLASAVALRALGYKVRVKPLGVRVLLVYGQTHAKGVLQSGDVIVRADRVPVHSALQLHELLIRHKVGDIVHLTFLRGGRLHTAAVEMSPDPTGELPAIIGIEPQDAFRFRLPVDVKFKIANVGGPSAGLAFALQILEESGRDVDRGYKVAATGEIGPDGSVAPIGGVEQKTIGAREAHTDVFLVPAGDNYRVAKRYAHGLRIIPVKTFQQALHALATLPPKR